MRCLTLSLFYTLAHAALDANTLTKQYFDNDATWYLNRIPLFESSIPELDEVYNYRWSLFRAHQRDLGANGFISTEFINDGRWCRDRRFKEDKANFLFSGNNTTPQQFSESMADGAWQGYLVDGVDEDVVAHLDTMQKFFKGWNETASYGGYDQSKGLYFIQPLTDVTEYTVASIDASGGSNGFTGGNAFRPSINCYQYANALAIANLATLKGDTTTANEYNEQAKAIKGLVQQYLWNSTLEHFIDRYQVDNENVTYWDFIRSRELVGYVPWTHDNTTFAQAWKHILDSDKLAGAHGLRTNEPSYEYYMHQYRYEGSQPECQWNGPVWPYQTTQVLTGLANLLDHYPNAVSTNVITTSDYTDLLRQYAQLHYNPERGGVLDIEENYNADSGSPIVGLSRSPHYFHSGFLDLVLSGFVGIRPRSDDVLEVNPLADAGSVSYFRADQILYHGYDIAVQWDASGSKYGTAGLVVEVDGKTVSTSHDLRRLTVNVSKQAPPTINRPVAVSVQLSSSSEYPKGSDSEASSNTSSIHVAIVWFFPETEIANGWDSPVGNGSEIWYQIDFGTAVQTSNAEIAFFSNSTQGFDVPEDYRIQINQSNAWVEVSNANYSKAIENGITIASWNLFTTNQIRLFFIPKQGEKVRLI